MPTRYGVHALSSPSSVQPTDFPHRSGRSGRPSCVPDTKALRLLRSFPTHSMLRLSSATHRQNATPRYLPNSYCNREKRTVAQGIYGHCIRYSTWWLCRICRRTQALPRTKWFCLYADRPLRTGPQTLGLVGSNHMLRPPSWYCGAPCRCLTSLPDFHRPKIPPWSVRNIALQTKTRPYFYAFPRHRSNRCNRG